MEEKINIAEILQNKSKGIRLYSPIFGECAFCLVREETDDICVKKHNGEIVFFDFKGLYNNLGEVMLFPSKEMRDWGKFSWKKGDVLVNKDGDVHIIFERFADDTYCSFVGKYYLWKENNGTEHFYKNERLLTSVFQKAGKDAAQTYISTIEERLGGKLNRETLEIEKTQPEFKDGDIVFMKGIKSELFANCIFILKGEYKDGDERAFYYAFYNADDKFVYAEYGSTRVHYNLRPATYEERQRLFDALVKENKKWDAEKKAIVNLPKKSEFKIFQKVLVRNYNGEEWIPGFFFRIHNDGCRYILVCGEIYKQCIPYNDYTEHLLGTTDEWKGGEG